MDLSSLVEQIWRFAVFLATDRVYAVPFWVTLVWLAILLNWRRCLTFVWRSLHLINDLVIEREFLKKIARPMQLLLIVQALSPFLHLLPGSLAALSERTLGFLVPFLTLYILAQTFDLIVFGWYMKRYRDGAVPEIIRFVVMAVVYIVLAMIFLEWAFGLNVLPLLATSTVLTAVLGLALQDTLKNLCAGLTMSLEKRFKQGDWVMFRLDSTNTTVGEVIEIGWRTTKIRTLENNYAVIPNAVFTSNQLTNFSLPTPSCLRSLELPVSAKIDLIEIEAKLLAAAAKVEGVLKEPKIEAQPISLKPDHVVFRLRFWISDFANAEVITGCVMEQCLKELIALKAVPACPPAGA